MNPETSALCLYHPWKHRLQTSRQRQKKNRHDHVRSTCPCQPRTMTHKRLAIIATKASCGERHPNSSPPPPFPPSTPPPARPSYIRKIKKSDPVRSLTQARPCCACLVSMIEYFRALIWQRRERKSPCLAFTVQEYFAAK